MKMKALKKMISSTYIWWAKIYSQRIKISTQTITYRIINLYLRKFHHSIPEG